MLRSLILFFVLCSSTASGDWKTEVETFRKETEDSLKKNWLVVVGLFWLREGDNTLGSSGASFIKLPASTPDVLGKITLQAGKTEIDFTVSEGVKLNGKPAVINKKYELITDQSPEKTIIEIDSVSMFLIQRPNGIGLRVKDAKSKTLERFKGLKWWATQQKFLIEGQWKPLTPPKILRVPDVLGNVYDETINGSVEFKYDKKTYELFPTRKGDDLFFVFKDASTGKSTYGTGRFLEAKVESDGKVMLDFNKAYNPPCAHIRYATCPMAPVDNILPLSIEVGEKTTGTGPKAGKSKSKKRKKRR